MLARGTRTGEGPAARSERARRGRQPAGRPDPVAGPGQPRSPGQRAVPVRGRSVAAGPGRRDRLGAHRRRRRTRCRSSRTASRGALCPRCRRADGHGTDRRAHDAGGARARSSSSLPCASLDSVNLNRGERRGKAREARENRTLGWRTPRRRQRSTLSRPHPARMYDYFLGGKNHFAADRETAEKVLRQRPPSGSRRGRTARSSAGPSGTWPPRRASGSSSTSAPACPPRATCTRSRRQSRPTARVVYADNDPLVLAHARALLTSTPEGRTAYIQADLRDPQAILSRPGRARGARLRPAGRADAGRHPALHPGRGQARRDHRDPARRAAAGSYLVASHVTTEHEPAGSPPGSAPYRAPGCRPRRATPTSSPAGVLRP